MSGNGDYQVSILPMLMLSFTLTYFQYLQHVKTVRDCGAGLSGPAIFYIRTTRGSGPAYLLFTFLSPGGFAPLQPNTCLT